MKQYNTIDLKSWKDIALKAKKEDVIPEGFVTAEQLSFVWETSISQAFKVIKNLINLDFVERRRFNVMGPTGKLKNLYYYRIKNVETKVQDRRSKARKRKSSRTSKIS